MTKQKTYSKAVISYYDILGFSELVNNRNANDIFEVLDVFRKASIVQGKNDLSIKVLNISDTIIRIILQTEYSISSDGHSSFYQEMINTSYILHDLLCTGILVRGAIVIDDIYCDSNCYFGPGIVNAYTIEKSAVFPRIVIDKNIIENLRILSGATDGKVDKYYHEVFLSSETQKSDVDNINRFLKQDSDSEYFLDYLYLLENEYNDEFAFSKFLEKHKEIITNGLVKYSKNENVQKKYKWLKRYHNKTIEQLIWSDYKGRDYYSSSYFFED